ncbi:uncharacterized protein MONBRDRAFT_23190 [Monosiga brevicollis MX1]|uniref:Uncharacterized protein n=1 Tax=Monosiga brevicollis TaxID=81824 RepID=A9URG0_MONBE|nr:uncharacterized protein MONBRDRAFT_23190 [Monosiga brevicollis MX1]EDQ92238.1 predicted protein [Monosiga brevicollis MX1]|eukprot:XP_001743524.1 hypothetical protein [Monosiga brevicollis MX1]
MAAGDGPSPLALRAQLRTWVAELQPMLPMGKRGVAFVNAVELARDRRVQHTLGRPLYWAMMAAEVEAEGAAVTQDEEDEEALHRVSLQDTEAVTQLAPLAAVVLCYSCDTHNPDSMGGAVQSSQLEGLLKRIQRHGCLMVVSYSPPQRDAGADVAQLGGLTSVSEEAVMLGSTEVSVTMYMR